MRPHGVYASILLAVFSYSHVTAKEPCVSYEVERKPGKALVGHVNTTLVLSQPDCMSACNKLLHCYSVNLYRAGNGDSMCEINKSNREISPGSFVPKPGHEYNQITGMQSCDDKRCLTGDGKSLGPIAHWRLDGTDKEIKLKGTAIYREDGGRKVLYLDGKMGSYAETPAVDFRTTSFTIAFWVKSPAPGPDVQALYGDWHNGHQFIFSYFPNGKWAFSMHNSNAQLIASVSGGLVPGSEWTHVAVVWDRDTTQQLSTYQNGELKQTSQAASVSLDLMANNHAVYDIGLVRGGGGKHFKGSIKEMMIFDRALQGEEVEAVKDSPAQQIAWKLKLLSDQAQNRESDRN